MTKTARTSDHRAEHPVWYEWLASPETDERAVAMEMIAALQAFFGSWFEPLAIEVGLGCYDREIVDRPPYPPSPPGPYQILVSEQTPAVVEVDPIYRAVETRVPLLSGDAVWSWIERGLAQSCGDPARYQTSLRNVYVRASRVALPPGWGADGVLPLECYAGTITIPIETRDDGPWVAALPVRHGLHQPIDITIENADGNVRS